MHAQRVEMAVVVSDKADAGVLRRARAANVPTLHLPSKGKSRVEFDAQLTEELERRGVDLILLVGYMRILSEQFCDAWANRVLNVHPSLLPEFAGGMDLAVHRAVLDARRTESGCTVHFVTKEVDAGPIVVQPRCPVFPDTDTPETLKARVRALENEALIQAVEKFNRGELVAVGSGGSASGGASGDASSVSVSVSATSVSEP